MEQSSVIQTLYKEHFQLQELYHFDEESDAMPSLVNESDYASAKFRYAVLTLILTGIERKTNPYCIEEQCQQEKVSIQENINDDANWFHGVLQMLFAGYICRYKRLLERDMGFVLQQQGKEFLSGVVEKAGNFA